MRRAGLGRLTGKPGLFDQVRGDVAIDNAEHLAHEGSGVDAFRAAKEIIDSWEG